MSLCSITELKGIAEIIPRYDVYVIGLWGVVTEGEDKLLPGALETVIKLYNCGKTVVFLSNSPLSANEVNRYLATSGINRNMYLGVLTAGEFIRRNLKARSVSPFKEIGRNCLYFGDKEAWTLSPDFTPVFKVAEADFILVNKACFPKDYIENYIPVLKEAAAKKLPLLAARGEDFYYNYEKTFLGSGSLIKEYEKIQGNVFLFGKPDKNFLLYCLKGTQSSELQKIIYIGDTLETDIKSANNIGIDSLLICGGKHSRELDLYRGEPVKITEVEELCRIYGSFPKYAMSNMQWRS